MTEGQAKTKICPKLIHMATIASIELGKLDATDTQIDEMMSNGRCVASDCMMWVWDEAFNNRDSTGKGYGGTNYNTEGHCGLVNS